MPNRLTRIYTRQGDDGRTSLGSRRRVEKFDCRIDVLGEIDELNCQLGVVLTLMPSDASLTTSLTRIQHELFDIGGELAMESLDYHVITEQQVNTLEREIDQINAELPPLKEFILPGGAPAVAQMHLARAVCRRAERRLAELAAAESVNAHVGAYLNRLSDLLFVGARQLGKTTCSEVLWQPAHARLSDDRKDKQDNDTDA